LMAQGEASARSPTRIRNESRRVARKKPKTGSITRAYCHIALSATKSARMSFFVRHNGSTSERSRPSPDLIRENACEHAFFI
jgi:hypothetical protein